MNINIKDLVTQITMITLKSEALAADVRVLNQTLRQAVEEALPQHSGDDSSTSTPCACPPNQRVAAATSGHPRRTKCRLCNKEHD